MFQILVPGDPKGALVLAVLASGILGDPGADSGGEGKSKQAEKNSLRKHPFLLALRRMLSQARKNMAQKKSKERPYFSAPLDFPLPPISAPGSLRMS